MKTMTNSRPAGGALATVQALCARETVRPCLTAVCIVWATAWGTRAEAQTFVDVTNAAGINHSQFLNPPPFWQFIEERIQTGGAAARDYDGDGFVDIYFTRMDAPDLLYRNQGDGTFAPVDPSVTGINRVNGSNGVGWADINNNGLPDLYVTTVDHNRNYLYVNNGNGTFTEQAIDRGVDLSGKAAAYSPAFGDYDNDGYLDMYTTSWSDVGGSGTALFHNRGAAQPGYFDNVTVAAGVDATHLTSYLGTTNTTYTFSPRFSDLNGDGLPDLAVTGDFGTSRLFWNNGDGTFTDGTLAAGVAVDNNGMGATIGDYNGDGHLDWFVSSIYDEDISPSSGWRGNGSQLYTNNGDGTFTATAMNTHWGWGSSFLDYDNDGKLDLAVTNGYDVTDEIFTDENHFNHNPTQLFQNQDNAFVEVGASEGITDMESGKGLLVLDFDNDGRLDLLVINNEGQPVLYHNQSPFEHDWIGFDTLGTISNADGIGALITVTEDGISQIFEVSSGSNYLSQNDKRAHFGLGSSDGIVDLVTVLWPSGLLEDFMNVPANEYYKIVEGQGIAPYMPVPEPASVVLACFAMAGLLRVGISRRKSRG